MNDGIVTAYSSICTAPVEWIWFPYIPSGKITVLQGDPGNGKSSVILDIISRLSTGRYLPNSEDKIICNSIYQCSEDSVADTIKPRLEKFGADCSKIGFINEDLFGLSLDDEKIRDAIIEHKAKVLVIDPFQAYIGDTDISNACGIRRMLRRISIWAAAYNCAVILIGHLNKKTGSKELYRGLGSIDVVAAARSVLQIDSSSEDENARIIHQVKNSLASKGADIMFKFDENGKISWDINSTNSSSVFSNYKTESDNKITQEKIALLIKSNLIHGMKEAQIMQEILELSGAKKGMIKAVKKLLGVQSVKIADKWYWNLPNCESDNNE